MKRFVVVSTLVGFCVPIWWGLMCFLPFTGPQSPTADMFWEMIHRTCPPWTIESPILGSMFATPFLNALLYGGVAALLAVPLGVACFWLSKLFSFGIYLKVAVVIAGIIGWIISIPPSFMRDAPWPVEYMPIGAWAVILATIAYFSIPSRRDLPAVTAASRAAVGASLPVQKESLRIRLRRTIRWGGYSSIAGAIVALCLALLYWRAQHAGSAELRASVGVWAWLASFPFGRMLIVFGLVVLIQFGHYHPPDVTIAVVLLFGVVGNLAIAGSVLGFFRRSSVRRVAAPPAGERRV